MLIKLPGGLFVCFVKFSTNIHMELLELTSVQTGRQVRSWSGYNLVVKTKARMIPIVGKEWGELS